MDSISKIESVRDRSQVPQKRDGTVSALVLLEF